MLQAPSEGAPSRPDTPLAGPDETLITGRHVRQLLGGCSQMHIWRLLNHERNRALAFPMPVKINARNYWRLGAIRSWIKKQEAKVCLKAVPGKQWDQRGRLVQARHKRKEENAPKGEHTKG